MNGIPVPIRPLSAAPAPRVLRTREELLLAIVGRIRANAWKPAALSQLGADTGFSLEELQAVEAEAREMASRPDPLAAEAALKRTAHARGR